MSIVRCRGVGALPQGTVGACRSGLIAASPGRDQAAGAAPGGETHYSVRLVSPAFAGMGRLDLEEIALVGDLLTRGLGGLRRRRQHGRPGVREPDLVALASGMTELLWFEAPNWERHVLATGLKRMINTWPMDTDQDGIPEFLVAHAFENEAARSVGHRGGGRIEIVDGLKPGDIVATKGAFLLKAELGKGEAEH